MEFRTVTEDDAGRLLEIYAPYVEKTAITFEYTVPSTDEFRARIHKTLQRYPYIAAVSDGKIIGYAYAGPFVGRAAYDWSVETSIYLDMERRRQGVGGRLYGELESILSRMHILNLNACIGCPKQDDEYLTGNSEQFHEHIGYRLVGKFHDCGYKFGRWYDMVWMEKMLGDHPDRPKDIIPFPELGYSLGEK